jgi:hypothetical protein
MEAPVDGGSPTRAPLVEDDPGDARTGRAACGEHVDVPYGHRSRADVNVSAPPPGVADLGPAVRWSGGGVAGVVGAPHHG